MMDGWKGWVFIIISSLFTSILITGFSVNDLEIKQYNTFLVIQPIRALMIITIVVYVIVAVYQILKTRNSLAAILIAMINPLIALLAVIFMYITWKDLEILRTQYPATNITGGIMLMITWLAIFSMQVLLEIKMIKTIRASIQNAR